jgi:hypothetical protein
MALFFISLIYGRSCERQHNICHRPRGITWIGNIFGKTASIGFEGNWVKVTQVQNLAMKAGSNVNAF